MAKTTDTQDDWSQIEIGDQVQHPKWGAGTVLFRSGSGDNAKAIVAFPEQGQVKLMLKYAKLKKTGSGSVKAAEKARSAPAKKAAPVKAPVKEEEPAEDEDKVDADAVDDSVEIKDDEVVGFDDDDDEKINKHGAGEEES